MCLVNGIFFKKNYLLNLFLQQCNFVQVLQLNLLSAITPELLLYSNDIGI